METAKADAAKPFPREEELREKSKRLAELTKLLKMANLLWGVFKDFVLQFILLA